MGASSIHRVMLKVEPKSDGRLHLAIGGARCKDPKNQISFQQKKKSE
jgi:hypothetical protein